MSEIDFEELIRSPLDDLEQRAGNGWSVAVVGAALGLMLGYLLTSSFGRGDDEQMAVTTETPATMTAPQATESADYLPGYLEIAPGLSAQVNEVVLGDDVITVAFTTAVKRGSDPAAAEWPVGGNWLLESATGTIVESSRVIVGRSSPGAFAVQFAAPQFNGETVFTKIQAIALQGVDPFSGSLATPFDGEPFTAPEPLTTPVNQEVTLTISKVALGRFLGSVEWQIFGADLGATVQVAATLIDENGDAVGSFRRFPEIVEPSDGGTLEIYWSEPFPTDQEGAVAVSVEYDVGVVRETPVSITFDLSSVPVGR